MTNSVTNRQLFFIIIISTVGLSAVVMPKIMSEAAGTGAWLSLLIAAVFFVADVLLIIHLGCLYRGKALAEYSELLVGKAVSRIFCGIYLIYFFIFLAFFVRSAADIIQAEILYKTPIWATMLLIMSVSLYAASKGLTNLGRILEYLGLIVLITGFILQIIAFTQGNPLNNLPLIDPAEISRYIRAVPSAIFVFLGFEVITVIPLSRRNGSQALLTAGIAVLVACTFFIVQLEGCYSILSIDDIVNYDYPVLTAIRRLDIAALQFAKRLDLFFIMGWLTSIFCTTSLIMFASAAYAKKLIPKLTGITPMFAIGGAAYATGLLIPNAEDVLLVFNRFTTYTGLLPAFVIPFVLWVAHLLRSRGST
ncbi:spore germination protein [Desulfitobacterium hafniense DCB-2]|uniref:Spore germination protein n=1 Tax=Desulfitobacterium hafniense (strain DSM 10664 / DCB-2) TaxID=272564 RepID=B8FVU3_DESHD|nr:GerAB/ArcD/ProY family transporter [Desulfitobacterium hafniense]ACL18729.1 spore germination protein [Desulfitobacterium hafniense DCB-2]